MACSDWFELVSATADDQVTDDERTRLDAHLRECPTCDALLQRLAADRRRLRIRPPAPHDALVEEVLATSRRDRHAATTRLRGRSIAAAVAAAIALGGLTSVPSPPGASSASSAAATSTSGPSARAAGPAVRIDAEDRTFDRADVEVATGEAVEWRNAGVRTHHLVVVAADETVTDVLAPGRSETATFSAPGTYRYWCSVHEGMEGTVTVDA